MLEFTLIGIPLGFILISIFEIARGMWVYETLAHAATATTRFLIVKGADCVTAPNACGVRVWRIAQEFRDNGVGLLPSDTNLDLTVVADPTDPFNAGNPCFVSCTPLQNCLSLLSSSNQLPWPTYGTTPPAPCSYPGQNIAVRGRTNFRSALSMFWPGAGGFIFGPILLGATSTEMIQF